MTAHSPFAVDARRASPRRAARSLIGAALVMCAAAARADGRARRHASSCRSRPRSGVDTITRAAQPALVEGARRSRSSSRTSPAPAASSARQALVKSAPDGYHAGDRVEQPRDLPERLQDAAVRSGRRHHADRGHRLHADRARRQSQGAGEEREGADRAAEGEARQDQLRARPATARSCISPRRCSSTRRASRRRTCRTRAWARC